MNSKIYIWLVFEKVGRLATLVMVPMKKMNFDCAVLYQCCTDYFRLIIIITQDLGPSMEPFYKDPKQISFVKYN